MNSSIETRIKNGVALADFSAEWCGPCRAQAPVIEKLSQEYQDQLSVVEIDIDTHHHMATKYMVQSIPTLILFKNGKEIKRFVGLQTEAAIKDALDKALQPETI